MCFPADTLLCCIFILALLVCGFRFGSYSTSDAKYFRENNREGDAYAMSVRGLKVISGQLESRRKRK